MPTTLSCEKGENQEKYDCCCSWTGFAAKRVPQPVPDPAKPFHYMPVAVTPSCTDNGSTRPVDWQKREYVVTYREHPTNLQSAKNIRAIKAREEEQRHRT